MEQLLRVLADAPAREVELWAGLAHELTVSARGVYPLPGHAWRAGDAEFLRAMNEMTHRVTAQIRALSSRSGSQFPADELARVLGEIAEVGHAGDALERAALAVARRCGAVQPGGGE